MTTASRLTSMDDAIAADEVGIEYGRYGDFRLRSSYQPIFKQLADTLVPWAVEGQISPYKAGEPVPLAQFLGEIAAGDGQTVERMCRALHLRNHRNLGVDGLGLYFSTRPEEHRSGGPPGAIDLMALLNESGPGPHLLICEIAAQPGIDDPALQQLAEEMRTIGSRIAIGGLGTRHLTQARLDLIRPEVVRIDGPGFRTLCRDPATVKLLASLVSCLHERSAKVLVQGVDDAEPLRVAIECGADLLQGNYLGRATLAGEALDWAPLSISSLLGEGTNVLRLRPGSSMGRFPD